MTDASGPHDEPRTFHVKHGHVKHDRAEHGHVEHPTDEELAEHAEELLPADRAAAVSAHLDGCAGCAETMRALVAVRDALADLPAESMPAAFADRIDAALAAEAPWSAPVAQPQPATARPAPPGHPPARRSSVAGSSAASTRPPSAGGWTTGRSRGRRLRRALLGAATAVVVVGGIVTGVVQSGTGGGSSSGNSGAVSGANAAPQKRAPGSRSAPPRTPPTETSPPGAPNRPAEGQRGTTSPFVFTAASIPQQARALASSGRRVTVPACATGGLPAALRNPTGSALGTYHGSSSSGGRPAALLVAPAADPSRLVVYVVATTCTASGSPAEVLFHHTIERH